MVKNSAIIDGVLAEFEPLTRIPRPSGHEKAVSDYLKKYLTDAGFTVVQDKVNNIIADKPATPGYEQAPRTILQGHMDMVCVAEEGVKFDPQHDAIKLHRTDEYLEAVGTSLGGDDGIGVAIGSYIMKHAREHGPLRLIVTVDEERGMTGSINLDGKSDDYIEAAFDMAKADIKQHEDGMAEQRKATQSHDDEGAQGGAQNNDAADDPEAAYAKLVAAEREMYMKGRE